MSRNSLLHVKGIASIHAGLICTLLYKEESMRKVVFLGSGQYLLKPMLTLALSGVLVACGSVDDPRNLNLQDSTFNVNEDEALISSVNQDLGDEVSYSALSAPTSGSFTLLSSGYFEYTPEPDFNGRVSFQFQAHCEDCETGSAVAEIIVDPVNDLVVVEPASFETSDLNPISAQLPASDVDGDDLIFTLESESTLGEAFLSDSGQFEFTPISVISFEESLLFSVFDGTEAVSSTIDIISNGPSSALTSNEVALELIVDSQTESQVVLVNNSDTELQYSTAINEISSPEPMAQASDLKKKRHQKVQMPLVTAKNIAATNGGIIVKYSPVNGAMLKLNNILSENSLKIERTLPKLNLNVLSAKSKSDSEIADTINYLNSLPNVIYAEPDYLVRTTAIPNDALFTQQWAVNNEGQTGGSFDADIDAVEAWGHSADGSNVVVAVIDTGVNYNHEDLANNMWVNADEIPGNGIDDDANGFIDDIHGFDFVNNDGDPIDDHDHGTHCAGIIGAEGNNGVGIAGAVHNAQIMAVKFLSAFGGGNTSDAIESVIYAVDNGADILSNSWGGGGFSQALMDAITYANDNDVMFIAAAGNSSVNNDLSPHYPSSYTNENVIAVASTTHSDGMSSFSNFGLTSVDLGAPGSDILSSVSDGAYASFSGTSMATPYVAGAAVLIRSNFPSLSSSEVKQILLESVDPIPALSDRTVTGGRLNIEAALNNAFIQASMVNISTNQEGVVAPGETVTIPFTVNALNRSVGDYHYQIDFQLSDPEISELTFDVNVTVLPDVIPPAAINDLMVEGVGSSAATLSWINTGDDEFEGNAYEIQIAYSQSPITEANWSLATLISGISPQGSGEMQQAVINGLSSSTTYFFAIKSIDNADNVSEISNVVSSDTLAGPDMSLTPGSIDTVVLTAGESEVVDLGVQNIGDEVLNYSLQVNSDSLPLPTEMANPQALNLSVELAKGANDVRVGEAVVAGSGGPDAYGYRWSDSDEGGATYDWRDISSLGSSMTFSDDSVRGPFSLGFDFEFYGEIQSQVWVSSNGFISFDSPAHSGCCTGQPIPSADGIDNIIAWAWDDLYPRSGYTAHYLAEADKFTIQFTNYGEYAANGLVTAQIIIYQNGRIKLQYKEFTGGFDTLRSSIGIENADGTDGLQVAFNTGYLHDELAVEFFSGPDWVGLSQSSGELEPGLNDSIGITFDSSAQSIGSYEAALHVMSNDADQPEVVIPLRMEVVAP